MFIDVLNYYEVLINEGSREARETSPQVSAVTSDITAGCLPMPSLITAVITAYHSIIQDTNGKRFMVKVRSGIGSVSM